MVRMGDVRRHVGHAGDESIQPEVLRHGGKHFNDLRGTACTNFYVNVPGLSDEEAADIMAWEPQRCRAIRKRYVDPARIAKGIMARMENAASAGERSTPGAFQDPAPDAS